MKILCLCYEYPPIGGGGAGVCKGACEALVDRGHEVDVVTSGMKDLAPHEQVNGVQIHRVRCLRPHRHYTTTLQMLTLLRPTYRKARELANQRSYDVVHCHFVVPTGVVAYYLAKHTGLPYVLTVHGSDIPGYNPDRFHLPHLLLRPLWRRIIRGSRAMTSPSNFLIGLIRNHVDAEVQVIRNGFDAPQMPETKREKRVLVATRLFERKGVQHVIRAFAGIDTDWELCIAGDGPYLPVLKKLAEDTGANVRFVGFVPQEELLKLYRSAGVFVFTSSQENFPMVLLEAMSAGCAIVTSSAPGCVEVVGDSAIVVPPENAGAVGGALNSLLGNSAEIERLGQLARQRAALFSWTTVGVEYESLLCKCANGKQHAGPSWRASELA